MSHSAALIDLMDSAISLSETAIESPISDEGWTPVTIIGHVSDVDEQVWHARISLMIDAFHQGLPAPLLRWWEPDAAATELKYRDSSLEQAIARLFMTRAAMIQTLGRLTTDEWEASAMHDIFGKLTVTMLPQKVLSHDEEHFESLA